MTPTSLIPAPDLHAGDIAYVLGHYRTVYAVINSIAGVTVLYGKTGQYHEVLDRDSDVWVRPTTYA